MRILQVVTDTDRRGAQVFAADLAPALGARGHDVETVALERGRTGGLDVEVLGRRRLAASTLRSLRARARSFDVVAAHGSTTLPACAAATYRSGTPFVYRQISESLFWAPTRWKQRRVRMLLRRACRVVSLSRSQADVLVQHFGVDRTKIDIVPNGVPGDGFAPVDPATRSAARARFGLRDDRPVVLAIGALVPEKGIDVVIDAVGILRSDDGDAQLLVVGAGPEREALETRAEGLRGVLFAGSITEPSDAYAAADVVVLASSGGDSMPATLIEAGLCGLPAVATPIGAIDEIVRDGETGRLVAVGDTAALAAAVGSFLDDPELARSVGADARAHCLEHFEIGVVAARWEQTFVESVSSRSA